MGQRDNTLAGNLTGHFYNPVSRGIDRSANIDLQIDSAMA